MKSILLLLTILIVGSAFFESVLADADPEPKADPIFLFLLGKALAAKALATKAFIGAYHWPYVNVRVNTTSTPVYWPKYGYRPVSVSVNKQPVYPQPVYKATHASVNVDVTKTSNGSPASVDVDVEKNGATRQSDVGVNDNRGSLVDVNVVKNGVTGNAGNNGHGVSLAESNAGSNSGSHVGVDIGKSGGSLVGVDVRKSGGSFVDVDVGRSGGSLVDVNVGKNSGPLVDVAVGRSGGSLVDVAVRRNDGSPIVDVDVIRTGGLIPFGVDVRVNKNSVH